MTTFENYVIDNYFKSKKIVKFIIKRKFILENIKKQKAKGSKNKQKNLVS